MTERSSIPWRDRPLLTMQDASEIAAVSRASIYVLAEKGEVQLVTLSGRTLVETASLIEMLKRAEPWTPSNRTTKATAARRVGTGENA